MSIKLFAPDNVTGASHNGIEYNVGEDGSLEVPNQAVASALADHGFRPWAEKGVKPSLKAMSRAQLVDEAVENFKAGLASTPTEQIRSSLLTLAAGSAPLPPETDAPGQVEPSYYLDEEMIDAMGRAALFAALKARGVAVALPVTNEQLKARLRDTLSGPAGEITPALPPADEPPPPLTAAEIEALRLKVAATNQAV